MHSKVSATGRGLRAINKKRARWFIAGGEKRPETESEFLRGMESILCWIEMSAFLNHISDFLKKRSFRRQMRKGFAEQDEDDIALAEERMEDFIKILEHE